MYVIVETMVKEDKLRYILDKIIYVSILKGTIRIEFQDGDETLLTNGKVDIHNSITDNRIISYEITNK